MNTAQRRKSRFLRCAATMRPVAFNPVGVGMGWLNVASGNPYISVAVPAVIAGVPGPVTVLRRGRRDNFYRTRRWWADADDNLSWGEGGEGKSEEGCQDLLLHLGTPA
jgi:hypothetical protein